MNDTKLLKFVVEQAGVGLNNGGKFGAGGDGWLRINIGCPRSILKEALESLGKAFAQL
jgi:cystathionine beta-lyase